ncbi:MAG: hypothetical protein U1E76_25260 [Planctomycetota bacterium]
MTHVHVRLGCRLTDGSEVVGAFTADALDPHAFEALEDHARGARRRGDAPRR